MIYGNQLTTRGQQFSLNKLVIDKTDSTQCISVPEWMTLLDLSDVNLEVSTIFELMKLEADVWHGR